MAAPNTAGTGAFGGVISTPYTWVWVSSLASLLAGVVLAYLNPAVAGLLGTGASTPANARQHQRV